VAQLKQACALPNGSVLGLDVPINNGHIRAAEWDHPST
jgi:hypothetical protein